MGWSIATDADRKRLLAALWLGASAALLAAGAAGAASEVPGAAYRLGAGDVIEVEVWREPDLSGRYTIDPSGALPHVLAGSIPAQGTTLAELAARLRAVLERDYLREARVAVALVESARAKVSLLGAVARPGLYPLSAETRLLELLTAAGGTTPEATGTATILRTLAAAPAGPGAPARQPARQRVRVDLEGLLHRGDLSQNARLRPGDVVVVAAGERDVSAGPGPGRVRVVGEVERPGIYPIDEAPTVLDALLAAGGLTDYASANRARLVRGEGEAREERKIRLKDVLHGERGAENPELRDGDMLVVPESFF